MTAVTALAAAAERVEAFAHRRLVVPGMAVTLLGPDGWERSFAVGVADAKSGQPMAADALMPTASIGKTMTALALLREAEAGRVDLDSPVHDHLPWLGLPTPFGPISLRHLLSHTAGIVGGLGAAMTPVGEALALARTTPGGPPGERFHYSDVGYDLLGLVLERVSGLTYEAALTRHVLEPCRMTASVAVTTAAAQADVPTGHLFLPDGRPVPAPWVPTASGAGSTLCTTPDLGRLLRVLLGGGPAPSPLSRDSLTAMVTPTLGLDDDGSGYGLGVMIDDSGGFRRIGHGGDCPGFTSYAFGCPETGTGVVILCNGPGGLFPVVEHGLALLRAAVLGLDPPAEPTPPAPARAEDAPARSAADPLPAALAPMVGTFAAHNPWVPGFEIRADETGGGLVVVWPWGDTDPLADLGNGDFRMGGDPASPERLRFESVVDGVPRQAVVSGWSYDRLT